MIVELSFEDEARGNDIVVSFWSVGVAHPWLFFHKPKACL
jgi:hypothetical protein